MQFLSIFTSDAKGPPEPEQMAAMGALVEEMMANGVLVMTAPLTDNEAGGVRARCANGEVTAIDGPFTDSKFFLASGFALMQAPSKEELLGHIRRFFEVAGDGECEILQIAEMDPPEA